MNACTVHMKTSQLTKNDKFNFHLFGTRLVTSFTNVCASLISVHVGDGQVPKPRVSKILIYNLCLRSVVHPEPGDGGWV